MTPANLNNPFGESCCDGGCSSTHESARSCGCDPGCNNHLCAEHQAEADLRAALEQLKQAEEKSND